MSRLTPRLNVQVIVETPCALGRADVAQALDAVDGLLERRRDLRLDGLRARADVDGRDRHDRRRDLRVLRIRQRRNDDQAGDEDDQRTDDREDRAGKKAFVTR